MAFDLSDCQFHGPALPEPYVKFELERELTRLRLLAKTTGAEGRQLKQNWEDFRRKLRELTAGGELRVFNHIIEPLIPHLGYQRAEDAAAVRTREETRDGEAGGRLLVGDTEPPTQLRVWTTPYNEDLFAPNKRGRAYRFSHLRIAQRVLLATGERVGLLTNGVQLMLLISDPARPDSTITIPIDPGWRSSREVPDSFRLLLALAQPAGVKALPEIVDKARLQQARVTKELRLQARRAVEWFIQELFDHPANATWLASDAARDKQALAKQLWREGLITVYRLLFILKLEASDDPARSFTFASTSLWRNTFSPSMALARFAQDVLHHGQETGQHLESGLRTLFRMFEQGLECTELMVKPMGGALFGTAATPVLDQLIWGERAVAWLLDQLLWTSQRRGSQTRERVHYGSLDVEDLGRVYEALLELEPGITTEPMCRLRRQKLEVVVPASQGEKYRPAEETVTAADEADESDEPDEADDSEAEEETTGRGKKTKVEWIEAIPPDRFYLRVGLGRKASGSYYTPHSFVRFLVQETLGPQVAERSPADNPQPLRILELKVLDPAMGSGHFLVEACRYLGDKLYEACRLCDDLALAAEKRSETGKDDAQRQQAAAQAVELRQRIIDLPDPDDELLRYLPSRVVEGGATGLSHDRAVALCRRLVATHCLYGVDKNPLAVELAKLALWLESHAEGMPLTFLDHRFVVGDSLTGPFWEKLLYKPSRPEEKLEMAWHRSLENNLRGALFDALRHVRRLEASVGATVAEMREKEQAKRDLDEALVPFRVAAAAWSGGVLLGPEKCDDVAYGDLLQTISSSRELPAQIESSTLLTMIARGLGCETVPADAPSLAALVESNYCDPALPYDLMFPEVFYPNGIVHARQGFHVVLGNPPWDQIQFKSKEFLAGFDIGILDAPTTREREGIEARLLSSPDCSRPFYAAQEHFEQRKRANDCLFDFQKVTVDGDLAGRQLDEYRVFMEKNAQLLDRAGSTGVVVPAAFHSNEGATGIRQLYLRTMRLRCCFSFENRRKLFEIDSRFKFAAIVAMRLGPTVDFPCAFYLHDDEWLFSSAKESRSLSYSTEFVSRTGGEYLSFIEPRSEAAREVISQITLAPRDLGTVFETSQVTPNTSELPMLGADVFIPLRNLGVSPTTVREPKNTAALFDRGFALLHEGKTFNQFDDRFGDAVRYAVRLEGLRDRPRWLSLTRYFRFAYRAIAASTNERTSIAAILPPRTVSTRKAASDVTPAQHPTSQSLILAAWFNSFSFDFALRCMVQTDVSLFIVKRMKLPAAEQQRDRFLCHSALRIICGHGGYLPLWREQLGDVWREPDKEPLTWPVLADESERWVVRATIDAVVANAYGLSREQFVHVLSTFSHTSCSSAPDRCLEAFDDLHQHGLEAFVRRQDPYWDIPLNENLPQPVIELPIPTDEAQPVAVDQWQETTGQRTFLSPGPLFDQSTSPGSKSKPAPKKRGPKKK